MKILYFDTETTGLDEARNDIIQIAGIVEIDGQEMERFEFRIAPRPENEEFISQEALDIHGFALDDIKSWEKPNVIHQQLNELFGKYVDKFNKADKFYPAGFNVDFDLRFLRQFYIKCGDKYFGSWFHAFPIDPLPVLRMLHAFGITTFENYKLSTVASEYGIELKAHDALSDIEATREIIGIIKDRYLK
ncbi:3'-5' exonuclease [bacterium]|nr:3'-5' exonuclease [bacterium]